VHIWRNSDERQTKHVQKGDKTNGKRLGIVNLLWRNSFLLRMLGAGRR